MHGQILAFQTVETPAVNEKEVNQQQARENLTTQISVPPKPPNLVIQSLVGPSNQSLVCIHNRAPGLRSTRYLIKYFCKIC